MDKKEYNNLILELKERFFPYNFYFISETAINLNKKKYPSKYYIISDIDLITLYSNFDKVTILKFEPFNYYISYKNIELFIKHFEIHKSDSKDFLFKFSKNNKNAFILNIFYDPYKEILFDFNSILHSIKNNFLKIENDSLIYILQREIIKNNLEIKDLKTKENTIFQIDKIIKKSDISSLTLDNFFSLFYFSITGKGKYKNILLLDKLNILHNFIPELSDLKLVNQNKDYHPEGNAFEHSLLTLKNIESDNFTLNLAALFHDIGKFKTEMKNPSNNEAKFPFHSRVGSQIAFKILSRWEELINFIPDIIEKISFLIENHMNIGFIYNLDTKKQKEILDSKYILDLLKLFKADALSSYKDLSRYKKVLSFIKSKIKKI